MNGRAKAGMNLAVHSSDLVAFSTKLRAELTAIRRAFGETDAGSGSAERAI